MEIKLMGFRLNVKADKTVKQYVAQMEQHPKMEEFAKYVIAHPNMYGRQFIGSILTSFIIPDDNANGERPSNVETYHKFIKRIVMFSVDNCIRYQVDIADMIKELGVNNFDEFKTTDSIGAITAKLPKTQDWKASSNGVSFITSIELMLADGGTAQMDIIFDFVMDNATTIIINSHLVSDEESFDYEDLPDDVISSIDRLQYYMIAFLHYHLNAYNQAMIDYSKDAITATLEKMFTLTMAASVHDAMEKEKGFSVQGPAEILNPEHVECLKYESESDKLTRLELAIYDKTGGPVYGVVFTTSTVSITTIDITDDEPRIGTDITEKYPDVVPLLSASRDIIFTVTHGID